VSEPDRVLTQPVIPTARLVLRPFEPGDAPTVQKLAGERDIADTTLNIERRFNQAELGYWIGKPFWNRGYATEAAIAVIRFGFASLDLNRIASRHFSRNPASGRVMQKAGLRHEGTARQSMIKWGKYEDLQLYAILREDWSGP
jgi:RimJ/RimL family protein N-acetyltransferase